MIFGLRHTCHTHTHTHNDNDPKQAFAYIIVHCSGGVGGPALAGALFDGVMNINFELLMGATGPPHFTRHYVLLCMYEIHGSDRNGSS